MAATWGIEIQVIDLPERKVMVRATRTDDGVVPPDVRSYSADSKYDTENNTPQELLAMYTNLFWDLYEAEIAKEAQIAALIGQAESALANALDAKEAG